MLPASQVFSSSSHCISSRSSSSSSSSRLVKVLSKSVHSQRLGSKFSALVHPKVHFSVQNDTHVREGVGEGSLPPPFKSSTRNRVINLKGKQEVGPANWVNQLIGSLFGGERLLFPAHLRENGDLCTRSTGTKCF